MGGGEGGCGSRTVVAHVNAFLSDSVQVLFVIDTHFLETFALSTRTGILIRVSTAFRQEIASPGAMVAENDTAGGEVEDGHAGANANMCAIPVTGDWWVCLGEFRVLLVQCRLLRHVL